MGELIIDFIFFLLVILLIIVGGHYVGSGETLSTPTSEVAHP